MGAGASDWCSAVGKITVPVVEEPGLSLYCFSVYMKDTGSPKPSFELELLKQQLQYGASIFSCAQWGVYSDTTVELGPGVSTIQVADNGDFHAARRPHRGWLNTPLFTQVWRSIRDIELYKNHNWVVKVDPDAVFYPKRLMNILDGKTVPEEGVYVVNCKFVDYGYFGNLEVYSAKAFQTLVANVDTCYTELDWKTGVDGGKFGPMGEDLFAQRCMDMHGVKHIEDFSITADGACPADRPKDQKKNKKFQPSCKDVTAAAIHPYKKPAGGCHAGRRPSSRQTSMSEWLIRFVLYRFLGGLC